MIRIRPYKDSDERFILSWCTDEDTYYKWTAGVLGQYPITSGQFRKTAELIRFTALDEKEPVGFFTLRNPNDTMDELRVGFVIVNPEKRRSGIGRTMLRQGLAYAFRIYGAGRVSLGVFEDNASALACYTAAGFHPTQRAEVYRINGKEKTAVEMECLPKERS